MHCCFTFLSPEEEPFLHLSLKEAAQLKVDVIVQKMLLSLLWTLHQHQNTSSTLRCLTGLEFCIYLLVCTLSQQLKMQLVPKAVIILLILWIISFTTTFPPRYGWDSGSQKGDAKEKRQTNKLKKLAKTLLFFIIYLLFGKVLFAPLVYLKATSKS